MPNEDASAETDMGNARRLVRDHHDRLRYVPGLGWICWDGTRWARDSDGQAMRLAKQTVRGLDVEAAALFEAAAAEPDDAKREKAQKAAASRLRHAQRSQGQPRLEALLACASTEKELVAHADDLDANPWLLNTPNGTVDLRTGELRKHDPNDFITKVTGAELDAGLPTPVWDAYLRTVFADDEALIGCFQRRIGYTASGDTREQCMFIAVGDGENGKTKGAEAIADALGDYAISADTVTFTTSASDRAARSDLARLRGAHMVVADEIDDGAAIAEPLIKRFTGGDKVVVRHLYREEFEYRPVAKLWLTVNRLPRVSGDDHAIWRRLQIIPFNVRIQRPDKTLEHKLATERAGILAWIVAGCIEWQRSGLGTCAAIENASAAYRQREDRLAQFLEECCEIDEAASVENGELRDAYQAWEQARGGTPMADLLDRLGKRGFPPGKSNGKRVRKGLRVVAIRKAGTGRDG